MPLRHPGGSAASAGTSQAKICTLFDNEFDPSQDAEFLEFIDDAKLIVWDGMFCDQEMPMRVDGAQFNRGRWPSSSVPSVSRYENGITHHAPSARTNSFAPLRKTS